MLDCLKRDATERMRDPTERMMANVRLATNAAIRSGKLVRGLCEVCGAAKPEAHHDDYSKPLDVRWLCSKHHKQLHRETETARRFSEKL
jgi:hypothetical protein